MKNLDTTRAYDLRYLNNEQLEEVYDWLITNDKGWGFLGYSVLRGSILFFSKQSSEWELVNNHNKPTTNALELFEDMKEITEEQKQQLINLNDSKVNEILGIPQTGKWYFNGNGDTLFHYGEKRYGFNRAGEWSSRIGTLHDNNLVEATAEEVEKALVNEAKRRGFGDRLEVWDFNGNYTIMSSKSGVIFEYGKWAESFNKQEIINQINELLKQL